MPTAARRHQKPSAFPAQTQLLFPLLEVLDEAGGAASPKVVADALAERVGLTPDDRARVATTGTAAGVNAWTRHVRWVRQRAKDLGFVEGPARNLWSLTKPGRDGLRSAKPGVVITVFETARGEALFARCETAMACLTGGSVNLILTSPPYPLVNKKQYGNLDTDAHVEWILELAARWKDLLADDGSLVLNMGPVWNPGQPTMSVYRQEIYVRLVRELGYFLAGEHYWYSPSKLPSPAQWVTVTRQRVTPAVEDCFWFSKSPRPKANNRNVLVPYSDRMTARLAVGGETGGVRPSGHVVRAGAFARDNGGAIAKNLLSLSHTSSNDAYIRHCKAHGLPVHPARFPAALADFWMRFLTEPGDHVYDPFGGSLTVGAVAEALDRRWTATEMSLTYLAGGASRFAQAPGFVDHVGFPGLVHTG